MLNLRSYETPAVGAVPAKITFPDITFTVHWIRVGTVISDVPMHGIAAVNLGDSFAQKLGWLIVIPKNKLDMAETI
jgi:hypothetical protein